jgi:hypothetical protein
MPGVPYVEVEPRFRIRNLLEAGESLFEMTNIVRKPPILVLACVLCAVLMPHSPAAAIDFLIPGISLRSVSLLPGARVSYLVVSESFGATDSSYVELRVLGSEKQEFKLEIITGPYPLTKKERITVRLRLEERVLSIASADEFRPCLKEILFKEGSEDFRRPTDRELDDLDIEKLLLRSSEGMECTPLEAAKIATPAGVFLCEGTQSSRKESRTVSLGGIEAERIDEEVSQLWISREVPLWGLVRSKVEERNFTKVSGVHPAPASPRVTVTQSVLISYRKPRVRS